MKCVQHSRRLLTTLLGGKCNSHCSKRFFSRSIANASHDVDKSGSSDIIKKDDERRQKNVDADMNSRRDQSLRRIQPKMDPKDFSIILFPGQGSQFVGMGESLLETPNVQDLFRTAKHILGYDLLDLCLNGPVSQLSETRYCQPAIFVTSLAAVEQLRVMSAANVENCCATAGFSLGEITALTFAGSFTFEDGLRLVKIRAEAMQLAADLVPSGMMTVIYGVNGRIEFACRAAAEWSIRQGVDPEYAVCSIANYMFPHCKVIAGHVEALKFIELNAKDFGIKRCKRLNVSGAFHTKLMAPAQKAFREALSKMRVQNPLIPVHSNYDAKAYKYEKQIREKLVKQMCHPVLWEQTIHNMYERPKDQAFPKTFSCGPGDVLLTTLKMANRKACSRATLVKV